MGEVYNLKTADDLAGKYVAVSAGLSLAKGVAGLSMTLDTIFAAVVAYFFLSIIFAILFTILFSINPNYFNLPAPATLPQFHLLTNEIIYFSLITIVGGGYGDILPLLPFSRMLAAVEAVVGHFYMAVLIGWLVGMFISQALRPGEGPKALESQDSPED